MQLCGAFDHLFEARHGRIAVAISREVAIADFVANTLNGWIPVVANLTAGKSNDVEIFDSR